MPTIFLGIARNGGQINEFLSKEFGISGAVSGSDLILADKDIDRMLKVEALRLHEQIPLVEGQEAAIADRLFTQISHDLKPYQPLPPDKIRVASGYGRLTEVDRVLTLLAVAPEYGVRQILHEEVLPLMINGFEARFVTGVSLDANTQQCWLSLSKIAMLAERYSPDEAKLQLQRHALGGVFPLSMSIQSYLDSLMCFSPLLFTLPVSRMTCTWHFQCSAMWGFPSVITNGIVAQFVAANSPLAKDTHLLGLHGLTGMSEKNIWRYLKFCVAGVNRLMKFLHDPRSFNRSDGSVDLLKKVQAYSAVNLLFADLAGINFSTLAHNRISYAMSALDKLANLRVELGIHQGYSDQTAMAELGTL